MHFVELYHGEFSEERLIRALGNVHPMEIYRVGKDNPAKLPGLMANVSQLYEELISYADLYDSASFEAKKMIVSQLIRRVEVYRGYQIHVDFNFDLAQYLENSDELAC